MDPYQFSLRGLVMGPGTVYNINQITGFGGQALRTRDVPKAMADGAFGGLDTKNVRRIIFDITLETTAGATFETAKEALLIAWHVTGAVDLPLYFQFPGRDELHINGRPRECSYVIDPRYEMGVADFVCVFECPDPKFYNAAGTEVVS